MISISNSNIDISIAIASKAGTTSNKHKTTCKRLRGKEKEAQRSASHFTLYTAMQCSTLYWGL
jgi:hypothetical protein